MGDQWVVDGGLDEGERIIVAGSQKVQPGMLVSAIDAQKPAMPAPVNVATTPLAPQSAAASQSTVVSSSK
jgi:membrane fusion protein (multidrug efflux system)